MRRPIRMTLLFCAVMAAAIPASASAATVGISDQQPSTFTNPLYAPLKLKVARVITPYDVLKEPAEKARLDEWIHNAKLAKQTMLISFEHSRVPSKYNKAPSVATYTKAIKAFKKKYGSKFDISPWNEVNVCQAKGRQEGQPAKICKSATGPKLVAQYYSAARSVFKGRKIVALDILDGSNVGGAVSYLRKFKKYVKGTPTYWGIHNYSDTNRGSYSRTSRLIKEIGNKRAQIWLTETGGQLKLRGKVYGEAKAAKALKCMFSMPRRYKQIKRLYIYQFNGADASNDFDAGLINPDNTLREGYTVVQKRTSATCRP
ncbi:hypothetical protein FSW04_22075 [Baekduia soli]|uniref:Asl1-like glycosyl hydrolase catalytic domain-containing protein n=1 Tax=Baekduia soli TaxID=496014 RepID=A0A5B8U9W2_9ACTN|nr:hypothetical protein [Baekduia soli]QEC49989.1 hypothetical protein FSW04_22075 [Baekduia soli]